MKQVWLHLSCIFLLTFQGWSEAQPTHQGSQFWQEGERRLTLVDRQTVGSLMVYSVEVRDASATQLFRLRGYDMAVDKAWIGYDGNLVLTGTTSTRAPHVLMGKADSPTNEWIRSWNYAFSPSGRYLAYQAFTPRTGGPPTPWSVVLIYDLEKSREENLPPDTSVIPDWPRDCTGRPVFPETNVFRDNCERGNEPDLEFNVHSTFLWSPDERRVYFLARENQDLLLVRVNLPWTRGATLPVWRQKLDMEHFHVTEAGYVYDPKRVSRIWADQLSWTTAGRIRVDLDPDYGFGSSFEIEAD